jgi:hypothetical protein
MLVLVGIGRRIGMRKSTMETDTIVSIKMVTTVGVPVAECGRMMMFLTELAFALDKW